MMDASTVVLGLVSFLQLLFMLVLARIFNTQDNLFKLIYENARLCREKQEKDSDEAKRDRANMKNEYTDILDNHYVTKGELSTLEEKLIGQIKTLATSIEHLTNAINNSFKRREEL